MNQNINLKDYENPNEEVINDLNWHSDEHAFVWR